jgi:hypothetical protein
MNLRHTLRETKAITRTLDHIFYARSLFQNIKNKVFPKQILHFNLVVKLSVELGYVYIGYK